MRPGYTANVMVVTCHIQFDEELMCPVSANSEKPLLVAVDTDLVKFVLHNYPEQLQS